MIQHVTIVYVYPKHTSLQRVSMMTSSDGNISALLAICVGNSPVPVNSPHKGQWRGALMVSLICSWTNRWVNNREADDLRRHQAHYDVSVTRECNIKGAVTLLGFYVSIMLGDVVSSNSKCQALCNHRCDLELGHLGFRLFFLWIQYLELNFIDKSTNTLTHMCVNIPCNIYRIRTRFCFKNGCYIMLPE